MPYAHQPGKPIKEKPALPNPIFQPEPIQEPARPLRTPHIDPPQPIRIPDKVE